jgi:hypothetical protein
VSDVFNEYKTCSDNNDVKTIYALKIINNLKKVESKYLKSLFLNT